MPKAIILMGSKTDLDWSKKIETSIKKFGIQCVMRIASAHKVPLICHQLIKEFEQEDVVFVTVAGRSNALSGFTDAQTYCPVIACPPYGDKFAGNDIYSSLRMPSGVAPMVVLEPENAALAVAKIFAMTDNSIKQKVIEYQRQMQEILINDDKELNNG
ncbi:MAG: AIR carboxylase family protein [Ignavibacteria bacterium]